jgi:glycosyltransferase involved in cell wall biosynthesis
MKTKSLTLTLVIPAYNESRHLKLCLDAVSVQTVMPDEVLVVDNNSTDATAKIAKKYSFVTVIEESKQGIVYARDKGFNRAKSKIIGRIDADTILPKNWVERVKGFYTYNSNNNAAWTSAGYFYNIRLPRFNGWVQSQITFRFNRILLGHYVLWGSTMAITRDQWAAVKSKTCQRNDIHEDLDLAIHLHKLDYKIHYDSGINVAVYMRRVLSDRKTLWHYLMLWPQTLRVHHMRSWVFGWLGALFLYISVPVPIIGDNLAKIRESELLKKLRNS